MPTTASVEPAPPLPSVPRGRPRVSDPGVRLSTRLPTSIYDELCRAARTHGMSLSLLVRELIKLDIRPRP